jgi:phosphatidylserine/phosphatidylglycerophosphate/cardiolipin synthase-like enzyme
MSTSATGTIQDEKGKPVPGITVVLDDISVLFDQAFDKPKQSDTNGQFSFDYAADFFGIDGSTPRQLRLRLCIGRHILKELVQSDVNDAVLALGIITVNSKSLGWLATTTPAQTAIADTGEPQRVTSGNAVEWLCDNVDAWGRTADLLADAATTKTGVDLMQLTIDIEPFQSDKSALQQDPDVVLRFSPALVATGDKLADGDQRFERMVLAASQAGSNVRIQLSAIGGPALAPMLSAAATLVVVGLIALLFVLIGGIAGLILATVAELGGMYGLSKLRSALRSGTNADDLERVTTWFSDAGASTVTVLPFYNRIACWSHGKIVINDNKKAILLGSPLEQSYFDSQYHFLDNPMRGNDAGKGPIHDMSVAVRGPAVGHMREIFDLHWNVAAPTAQLSVDSTLLAGTTPADLSTTPGHEERLCSVQVVRTLNSKTFAKPQDGEQGILEAYLRAIHFAAKYIYIENQYFVNDAVIDAVIDALLAKPDLQLILFLNAVPDVPFYPGWQRAALRRIAQAAAPSSAPPPTVSPRFGVFTAWCHAASTPDHTLPRLRNYYLHTKSAIIDGQWATVGSANLDGVSLDRFQLEPFVANRSSETNCVFFADTGDTGTAAAIDALRRQLWSEHLGIQSPTSPLLDATDTPLALWRAQAEANRVGLNTDHDKVSGIHVLEWKSDFQVSEPAKMHLGTEGVVPTPFEVIEQGSSYDFVKGQWKK